MSNHERIYILGIGVTSINKSEVKDIISDSLKSNKSLFICTPNPEMILGAQKDEELHYILNNAELSIPDGIGLKFASWMMGKNISRWAGSEITDWLLGFAEKNNYKVSIVNSKDGLSTNEEIINALRNKFPDLAFNVISVDKEWSMPYYQELNVFRPQIIFVALGSPYQEKFIYHNRTKFNFANIFIGVGGSFDYLSGKVRPAPAILKKIGLEWFWRLLNIFSFSHPAKRLKRIFNAVVIFPISFLKWRLYNPFVYRKNVVCLVYKIFEQRIYILLIERSDEIGHWQLPQGGTDNMSLFNAGVRELQEELGTFKFKPIKCFSNIHKYSFPDFDKNVVQFKLRNYKGQKQGLMIAEFNGDDNDIKLNFWEYRSFEWVSIDNVISKIHPKRQESMKKILDLFNRHVVKDF